MLKINIQKTKLLSFLTISSRITSTKSFNINTTGYIKIQSHKNNTAILNSTNLEVALTSSMIVENIEEGVILLPAKLLQELLSGLNDERVEIRELENYKVQISTKNSKSVLNGLNPSEFPEIPENNSSDKVSIQTNILKEVLSQTVPVVSKDESRPVLTGLFVYSIPDLKQIVFVGTDGYRLAEKKLTLSENNINDFKAIIPLNTILDLQKSIPSNLDENEKETIFSFGEDQISITIGKLEIISRLIDGSYPPYQDLIPKESEIKLSIDKEALLSAVKLASLFARESAGTIKMSVSEETQKLTINSIANQVGENSSEISISVKGSGDVSVNSKFIIDALNCLDAEIISIKMSGKLSPCILQSDDSNKSSNYQHIVMPLRG
jgi:DNA polymerase-3 subunit beta